MKGSKVFDNEYYPYKFSYSNSNENHYAKLGSSIIKSKHIYNTNINKSSLIPHFKEKEEKKFPNAIKVNQISKKTKQYNNDIIKSYSDKKKDKFISIYNMILPPKKLSSYKQILDKMVEEFASDENRKENINTLLKRNIASQKYLIMKKKIYFSPSFKQLICNNNKTIKKNEIISLTDNRSKNQRNKNFIYNIIKIQASWRGYYLRKIVVRGMEKYHGLIYIYRLLKKYILKRIKNIFDILMKTNNLRHNSKSELKDQILYTKKILYSNATNTSDRNSFSFSNNQNEIDKNINEQNTKTYFSNESNKQIIINPYSHYSTEFKMKPKFFKNRLTNSMKVINIKQNVNSNSNLDSTSLITSNENIGSQLLYSSIIKNQNKNNQVGKVTSNFFKKYESETNHPVSIKSEFLFRKPIYKKASHKKKYIYNNNNNANKNQINDKKNIYDKKKNYHSNSNYNTTYKQEQIFHFNNTLFNVYKFVFAKFINFIKKKVYKLYFQNFLYQLKIKRKVMQLKSNYSTLLSLIQKIEKKRFKKYLDIYRENVLTLRANELIRYEKIKNINKRSFINEDGKNKYKKKFIKKNNNEININKNRKNKTEFKNNKKNSNLNNTKNTSHKKDILIKLLKIKRKYLDKLTSKYFYRWIVNSNNINSNKNFTFQKIIKYNINLNNNYNTVNNESNKISVNKKKLKIKKVNDLKHSLKAEKKQHNSLSKEKTMRIIKRISNPEEYIELYNNTFSKNAKDSSRINNSNDILLKKESNLILLEKIFHIIDKLESKKKLFKFFIDWKKTKK